MEGFEETTIPAWKDPESGLVYTEVLDHDTQLQIMRPLDQHGRAWWLRRQDIRQAMNRFLPIGGLFLDIGAHHGEYTLHAAHFRESRVLAFEPDKHSFEILKYNTRSLRDRVTLRNVALSDEQRVREFHSMKNSACSGLKPPNVNQNNVARVYDVEYHTVEIACPIPPDLIKIDTEGHEANILHGIAAAGFRCPIIVEPHGKTQQHGDTPEALAKIGWGYDFHVGNIDRNGFATTEPDLNAFTQMLFMIPSEMHPRRTNRST